MSEGKVPNFFQRLGNFGIGRIFKSADFIIAIIITLIGAFTFFNMLLESEIRTKILTDISSVSISIMTIVLAGFAIVISLSDKKFIALLKRYNLYENIIFYFEWTTLVSIFTFIITFVDKYLYSNSYFFFFNIFLMIYLIGCLIKLMTFITKFSIFKGEISSL